MNYQLYKKARKPPSGYIIYIRCPSGKPVMLPLAMALSKTSSLDAYTKSKQWLNTNI